MMKDSMESAIEIVGLTREGRESYGESMKAARVLLVLAGMMLLNSCGLAKSVVQLPLRTLGSAGRAVGF
jgi:hypothetical protein